MTELSEPDGRWPEVKAEFLARLSDQRNFVRAVLSGRRRNHRTEFDRVDVRPVLIKEQLLLHVTFSRDGQTTAKNQNLEEFVALQLLDSGFANFLVETRTESYEVRIGKRGQVFAKSARVNLIPDYHHDQQKRRLLEESDPYLKAVGISDSSGRVKPSMQDKYRQVEEFLRILEVSARPLSKVSHVDAPLTLIDLGCGHAYLTFAAARFFQKAGHDFSLIGIDVKPESREHNERIARELGIQEQVRFIDSAIGAYPVHHVDIAIALHACDTATDDALAWAVKAEANLILAAPCCHHDLHAQIERGSVGQQVMRALPQIFEHGILTVRVVDALTDALRAALLGIAGYKAEVFEFISGDHTARNLMIRAVRSDDLMRAEKRNLSRVGEQVREYRHTCEAWGVKPALESRLQLGVIRDSD